MRSLHKDKFVCIDPLGFIRTLNEMEPVDRTPHSDAPGHKIDPVLTDNIQEFFYGDTHDRRLPFL